jgi:hypothetical protein
MSYPRSRYRPRPPYRGNPLIVARLPIEEWRAVHGYADQHGITISEVIREAVRGVIQRVITTASTTAEIAAGSQTSHVPRPAARAPTGHPLTVTETLEGRLNDKPAGPLSLGQNNRLPRLEDQRPSDITPAVPRYDHLGRWQRRQEKRIGKLIDRPGGRANRL